MKSIVNMKALIHLIKKKKLIRLLVVNNLLYDKN